MKQGKIYMKAWLDLHGRAKVLATDHWYLEFANFYCLSSANLIYISRRHRKARIR